jgi:hypothetical protein
MKMTFPSTLAAAAATFALALSASLLPSRADAQTYTKQQLQETYTAYLSSEGFRPELTSSGNVKFRREGRSFLIFADENDPTYFRMVMAFSAEDKSAQARLRRLEGCNTTSFEVKVVKCYLDNDGDPNFSAEMFLVVPGDFKTALTRLLRAMDNGYEKYQKKVADLQR